jgi:hypothetical protein
VENSFNSLVSDYEIKEDGTMEFVVPVEDVEQELQKQVEDFISSKTGLTRSPTWVNLTQKVIETKYPVASGYAGKQPTKGTKFPSGSFVNAPNKTKYFKLHVSEKCKVQKVAVYGAPYTNPKGPKQLLYYTYPKTLYSRTLSAKAQ